MPGIIAVAGVVDSRWDKLLEQFAGIWESVELRSGATCRLAAHSHRGVALQDDVSGRWVGVDGEASIYQRRSALDLKARNDFAQFSQGFIKLGPECRGNVVAYDSGSASLYFSSEWTGTFPLYYLQLDDCLLLSSHLRPLARASESQIDLPGILQFLRLSYNVNGRTFFRNVHRVLPGEAFRFDTTSGVLKRTEHSRLWTGYDHREGYAERNWKLLSGATSRALSSDSPTSILLSGGWDSRTLLAAALRLSDKRVSAYTHGDTESRELRLVRRLAAELGVNCRLEAIDDASYDIDALGFGFGRVENVVFPHWHRAGVVLARDGTATASAGVYGEVLGGHYGPAMRLAGLGKALAVAKGIVGIDQEKTKVEPQALLTSAYRLFALNPFSRPWTVHEDAWRSAPLLRETINADIHANISRLVDRGIYTSDQIVEAYISENRGTQYINSQLLSCRAVLDVAMPFVDQELLLSASRTPISVKIHNRLNQQMLKTHAPQSLQFPFAATLIAARHPIFLQETSRFCRSLIERAQWKLHFATKQRTLPPRLGWVNFEFLRDGKSLMMIVDDLRSCVWDRKALIERIAACTAGGYEQPLHPISDAIMKVYTADLMLR
jgi:hypothetical protein